MSLHRHRKWCWLNEETPTYSITYCWGGIFKTMMKLLSKFKNQFLSKFKKLSPIKKIALIMVVLFGLFWYWATKTFYYYIIHTIGIPQLSSLTGVSEYSIDWILYRLPFYCKLIGLIIALPIILIIFLNKRKKQRTK